MSVTGALLSARAPEADANGDSDSEGGMAEESNDEEAKEPWPAEEEEDQQASQPVKRQRTQPSQRASGSASRFGSQLTQRSFPKVSHCCLSK